MIAVRRLYGRYLVSTVSVAGPTLRRPHGHTVGWTTTTPLGKGILLVAAPALNDPNFRQAVVLLCEHGPEGALGVIVNRPTGMSISEALPG